MMVACTIITADYIHYALALYHSLQKHSDIPLYILIVDKPLKKDLESEFHGLHVMYLSQLEGIAFSDEIILKYQHNHLDALRWSLKPVLLSFLLQRYNKVICLDCDVYFYNRFDFIESSLDDCNFLLTPHWRNSNPIDASVLETLHFEKLFNEGLYNAGFVGAKTGALDLLTWWSKMCHYRCEKLSAKGFYVDQTYLNLMPVYFEGVSILKHQGCNLAEWNYTECKRIKQPDGTVLINGRYPIVFIHFSNNLSKDIENGVDPLLIDHLNEWRASVSGFSSFVDPYKRKSLEVVDHDGKSWILRWKKRIRIRKRIQQFMKG